jgi:hypothetical protein
VREKRRVSHSEGGAAAAKGVKAEKEEGKGSDGVFGRMLKGEGGEGGA